MSGNFGSNSYSNVTITSAALIIAASPNRKGITIYNNGAGTLYIGLDSSVSSTTGYPMLPQSSMTFSNQMDGYRGAIYGVSSASSDVRYIEWIG